MCSGNAVRSAPDMTCIASGRALNSTHSLNAVFSVISTVLSGFVFPVLNRDYSILQTITRAMPTTNLTSCSEVRLSSRQPCLCHYDICIGWYPCGLKYCRGKDSAGRIVSYRCGIKTCSRCRQFEFQVASKFLCVWDEVDFEPFFSNPGSLHDLDDPLVDVHSWNKGEKFLPQSLNETLPRKSEKAVFAPFVDGADSNHIVKVDQRLMKVENRRHNGGANAKANALDDDEDAD